MPTRARRALSEVEGSSRPHRPALQYCGARSQPTAAAGSSVRTTSRQTPHLQAGSCWSSNHWCADPDFHSGPLLASHRLECPLTVPFEPLLVVILGPTGSGKTALSLALAVRFGGEIVNCDSVAMYREFEIGTAKPTLAERARAPHHLFDFVDPADDITAGEYARHARQILQEIRSRRALPIVVGGTGLVSPRAAGGPVRRAPAFGRTTRAFAPSCGRERLAASAPDLEPPGPGRRGKDSP